MPFLDTVQFKVFLTYEKIEKILDLCTSILTAKSVSIRKFASLIGVVVHAFNAILPGPLHYRAFERDKIRNLKGSQNYDLNMILSQESRKQI